MPSDCDDCGMAHTGTCADILRSEAPRRPTRNVGRPRVYQQERVSTKVVFGADLHARLKEAARDRDLSMNLMMNRAVEDYLDRLVPIDEVCGRLVPGSESST